VEALECGRTPAAAVGIDVAEPHKGLDLVALAAGRQVVAARRRLSVEEAVSLTLGFRPAVVCIDSPSGWSSSGPSRLAERRLAKLGIQSFRTGRDPGDHPFYRWMRVGFELYRRLAASYPLYRGSDPVGTAAEVFPHATACLLAGGLRPPGTTKQHFRREILDRHGVPAAELSSPDQVDAGLAALTGVIALGGCHSAVGDPAEGVILLPVPRVPDARLHALSGRIAGRDPRTPTPTAPPESPAPPSVTRHSSDPRRTVTS
jgi:predicted nuclease with RNAse H fold